jgi:hypothetical protein
MECVHVTEKMSLSDEIVSGTKGTLEKSVPTSLLTTDNVVQLCNTYVYDKEMKLLKKQMTMYSLTP